MFRAVLIVIGVVVAMIVNRDVKGDRRRGPIVLAGTIGGLLLGIVVAYLLSPSSFRFEGLDVLDICLFAGTIGGILASWIIGSSLTRRGSPS
jgi:hypothetical protein